MVEIVVHFLPHGRTKLQIVPRISHKRLIIHKLLTVYGAATGRDGEPFANA
jgi:hypothetical protein